MKKIENILEIYKKQFIEQEDWFTTRKIVEVEAIVADQAGHGRGKILPLKKLMSRPLISLPRSVFYMAIDGTIWDNESNPNQKIISRDVFCLPDISTAMEVPWAQVPTCQIFFDAMDVNGQFVREAPRNILREVLQKYKKLSLQPIVAPEIEFYLIEKNINPDYELVPPKGRSGRQESGRQTYSISAVNEFDHLFEDIYEFAERQNIEIATLSHEEGVAQVEFNLQHGEPMKMADQVSAIKRTIKEASLKHNIFATFMAKPMIKQPGSALHIHTSLIDKRTSNNAFSNPDGSESDIFRYFLGGLQTYIRQASLMIAPFINSFRRFDREWRAPANIEWGYDNRSAGLRIPPSTAENRRIENRLPSSDANPYLVFAATLLAGYLGIIEKIEPRPPKYDNKYINNLPVDLLAAINDFKQKSRFRDELPQDFIIAFSGVKLVEYEKSMSQISPWEREFLMMNV